MCTPAFLPAPSPYRTYSVSDGSGLRAVHRQSQAEQFLDRPRSSDNRLLVFNNPLSNTAARQVIGQPDFTSNAPATTASGFAGPKGLTVDKSGNLYVTDEDNNRVLRFDRAE